MGPERFCYTHPPDPTVVLPARRRASRSACRRHVAPGFALRARTPHLAVGGCARSGVLMGKTSNVFGRRPCLKLCDEGHGGKASLWAGAGVEECQCPSGASRRIGATNRGAACVALPPPSSGDICRPPRPGERPQRSFSSMPRGPTQSYPRLKRVPWPPKMNPSYVNTHFGLQATDIARVLEGVRVP